MLKKITLIIQNLVQKFKTRKTYDSCEAMPSAWVAFFGAGSFLISTYLLFILAQTAPLYTTAANKTPISSWGAIGWTMTVLHASFGGIAWHYGRIAWRCNSILGNRWYK